MSDDTKREHNLTGDQEDPSTPTRIFTAIIEQIQSIDVSLEGLHTLLNRIKKNQNAFDEEDQRLVQSKIDQYEQEKSNLQSELSRRQNLYQSTVKRMEQALSVRMDVLQQTDTDTQVLERHPELMEQFVAKQTALTEMLHTMKETLSSPFTGENDTAVVE